MNGILLIILTVALAWLIVRYYIRDRAFLRKRTREALSPEMRAQFEKEREEASRRQQKFRDAVEKAKRGQAQRQRTP